MRWKCIDNKEIFYETNAQALKDGQEGHDDGQQEEARDDKVPGLINPEDAEHVMKYTHAEWLAHMEQQKMWDEVDAEEAAMTPEQKAEMDKEQAFFDARLDSYFNNTNTKRRGNYPASMAGDGQHA